MAVKMAAGKFETMDLAQVFGDYAVDQMDVQPGLAEILDTAHKQVVARTLRADNVAGRMFDWIAV